MLGMRMVFLIALVIFSGASVAEQTRFDDDIASLQQEFNATNTRRAALTADQQAKAFELLRTHAEEVSNRYSNRAEPLVWQAWALCEYAQAIKSFGSMGAYKEARKKLEKALELNPKVFNGKPWITLARLYHHLPSWPISYGSKSKAREFYLKGLSIDPSDCEANYFLAELLVGDEDYVGAMRYLEVAEKAQQQKGEELAYMKPQIDKLIAKITAMKLSP